MGGVSRRVGKPIGARKRDREDHRDGVREAAQGSASSVKLVRAKKLRFSAALKIELLRKVEAAEAAGRAEQVAGLLQEHGLSLDVLDKWRRDRDAGELAALAPRKRGRKPLKSPEEELASLRKRKAQLEEQIKRARVVVEVQQKVAALLGKDLPRPAPGHPASATPKRGR